MPDLYIPVYPDKCEEEEEKDNYILNVHARSEILGPLNPLIKFSGLDDTYSLFKSETRKKWYSWICTPLSLIIIISFFYYAMKIFNRIQNVLSWEWAELLILYNFALLAFFSALNLAGWTRKLFFLEFRDACKEAGRQSKGMPVDHVRWILIGICFALFIGSTTTANSKYIMQRGHGATANTSSDEPLLDHIVFEGEFLFSFYGAFISALALTTYGTLHGIAAAQIDQFNQELAEASKKERLASGLEVFSAKHAAVVNMVRILSKRVSFFATFSVLTSVIANFSAMFLSFGYRAEWSGLSHICVVIWTILAIAIMAVTLLQPSRLQKLLNKGVETILADKNLWRENAEIAQLAQSMVIRVQNSNTKVTLFNCLRLSQWSGEALMLLPPAIGGVLLCIKWFA